MEPTIKPIRRRWCQAGKNHIWLRQDWSMQLCCSLYGDTSKHILKLEDPKHLFRVLAKEWPKRYRKLKTGPLDNNQCRICIEEEDMHETIGDEHANSQREKLDRLTDYGTRFFLKIDFSNKCNLKCTMCSSKRSTGWIKDEQKMNKALHGDGRLEVPISPHQTLGTEWFKQIPIEWFQNLGAVEISGGEPLYQEDALEFIEFLSIEVPNIQMRIITNTTLVDDKILSMLEKFTHLSILCSVDAWENDCYQYVRGGVYELPQIKENIIKLSQITNGLIVVTDTIHPANYNQYPLGAQFIEKVKQQYNPKCKVKYSWSYVTKPLHLNPRTVLPEQFVQGEKDLKEQKYFYNFTSNLDRIRKQSILDIRPEFEPWWLEMENICKP